MMNLIGEKLLRIEYIPITQAARWDRNPKRHDLPALIASIRRYGFRDAPIYDSTLSALVAGNGRATAVESMWNSGETPPAGVATDPDGTWYIPVQFGNDAPSVAVAEAFAIDHNNLTVSGSGLDPAALWDAAGYADVIRALADGCELPETVGADAAAVLLGYSNDNENNNLSSNPKHISSEYAILIEFETELQQVEALNKLTELGYQCRALTS